MDQQKHSKRRRSGFTLIEIMVAAVITIIMIGLVIQITSEVLNIWNRSVGKLSANAEARIAMEVITSDLETAIFRNDGLRWLEARDDNSLPTIGGYSTQTISLAFFTTALDRRLEDNSRNPIPGNVSAVEYKLVYQDPVTGDPDPEDNTYALHRRLIDPVTTFSSLLGAEDQTNFGSWLNTQVTADSRVDLDAYSPTGAAEHYLAGNIVNFQVTFYVIDVNEEGDEVPVVVPSPVQYGGPNSSVGPQAPLDSGFRHPIEYAEISLTIVSDEGMQILRNLADDRAGTGYSQSEGVNVVLEHGEVFKRRVYFQAKPL